MKSVMKHCSRLGALGSDCLKEALRTEGNFNLGEFGLSGGFVRSSSVPVKYKEATLVVGFLAAFEGG